MKIDHKSVEVKKQGSVEAGRRQLISTQMTYQRKKHKKIACPVRGRPYDLALAGISAVILLISFTIHALSDALVNDGL